MREKVRVRVRAVEDLVVCDDAVTLHVVPRGMTGTVVGCRGVGKKALEEGPARGQFLLVVDWDFHLVGDSTSRDEQGPAVCESPFSCNVPPGHVSRAWLEESSPR